MATRITHQKRIETLIAKYQQTVGVSPAYVFRVLDWAIRYIWRFVAPSRPQRYRKIATLTDGDSLPADWIQYARGAFYTTGGIVCGFHYVDPAQIGMELTSTASGATASWPGFYVENCLFNTLPAGLANVSVPYYALPPLMATGIDSTDDNMPQETLDAIDAEAARALMEMSGDENKADETLLARQKASLRANDRIIKRMVEAEEAPTQEAI